MRDQHDLATRAPATPGGSLAPQERGATAEDPPPSLQDEGLLFTIARGSQRSRELRAEGRWQDVRQEPPLRFGGVQAETRERVARGDDQPEILVREEDDPVGVTPEEGVVALRARSQRADADATVQLGRRRRRKVAERINRVIRPRTGLCVQHAHGAQRVPRAGRDGHTDEGSKPCLAAGWHRVEEGVRRRVQQEDRRAAVRHLAAWGEMRWQASMWEGFGGQSGHSGAALQAITDQSDERDRSAELPRRSPGKPVEHLAPMLGLGPGQKAGGRQGGLTCAGVAHHPVGFGAASRETAGDAGQL
ncbi:MAG TPA: hypothetical protein VEA99_05630 [Gemmatimonadaceae bacterium]|nr:hypothetical protein [Gemmatimonadaceae bacterium]